MALPGQNLVVKCFDVRVLALRVVSKGKTAHALQSGLIFRPQHAALKFLGLVVVRSYPTWDFDSPIHHAVAFQCLPCGP